MNPSTSSPSNVAALQRTSRQVPMATIQTPQGPAMVQVIDIPGTLGASGTPNKPGGINILAAVLRRWWLVLLVTLLVGGSGALLASRLISPTYEANALVLYHSIAPVRSATTTIIVDPAEVVRTQIELLTKPEIALLAARSPELQQALPWLKGLDLDNPAVQRDVARRLRNICTAEISKSTPELVQIHTEKPEGSAAAAVVNAFADAFVEHCSNSVLGRNAVRRRKLQEQVDQQDALLKELARSKQQLLVENNFDVRLQEKTAIVTTINEYQKLRNEADIKRIAAEAELARFLKNANDSPALSAEMQLGRKRRIEEEKLKDSLLQAAIAEQVAAYGAYTLERGAGKTEQHPSVVLARQRLRDAEERVKAREAEIAAAIDAKVADEQRLMAATSQEQAEAKLREAQAQVAAYEKRLEAMDQTARKLAIAQQKLEQINGAITRVTKQYDELWGQLQSLQNDPQAQPDAVIMVAERADVPTTPSDDKRVKVQAASLFGGLFLGIFLALLVDKFDKRLRDPRDIEPLLGAPMLGMIPRIQELRRHKGEQSRGLIAEEFRLIRTQLLFADPEIQYRTLCITSPAPSDGKTSLAVNLAISMAKSGRRVLLIDADLRKPDIHRIFNFDETPGLAELVLGKAPREAAIRATDVENLHVLIAGQAGGRPCEVLSRPEMPGLLASLAQDYDHVILDSAPLLPVSDTHVLLTLVEGVICAFNAQVDSHTVKLVEQILRRSRANLVGSVVNQVKYRRSTSYYRGKVAYSGYYSAPPAEAAGVQTPPGEGAAPASEDSLPGESRPPDKGPEV